MKTRVALLLSFCVSCVAATPALEGTSGEVRVQGSASFRLAFGSCAHQDKPQPILREVVRQNPHAFIYLGDNIYGDTNDDISVMTAAYEKLASKEEFQMLRKSIPLLQTWDDHDYGANDAGREYPLKEKAKEVFLDFWEVSADDVRRTREGIYYSKVVKSGGKIVQLIVLDTRTFRGAWTKRGQDAKYKHRYKPADGNNILGKEQWKWLEVTLAKPADVHIIASSIQFSGDYHGFEAWANAPDQRAKMADLIEQQTENPVIFISGDVHHGELSMFRGPSKRKIYDLTSSGINQVGTILEPSKSRVGEAFFKPNIGMITIDWRQQEVRFELLGEKGESGLLKTVDLSAL
ncbi:MAG: alkaline phosphatase D family protein [Myxococcota bacterium]|nr:alkaline phosphatase D family protein [Myxococcota bacterium]